MGYSFYNTCSTYFLYHFDIVIHIFLHKGCKLSPGNSYMARKQPNRLYIIFLRAGRGSGLYNNNPFPHGDYIGSGPANSKNYRNMFFARYSDIQTLKNEMDQSYTPFMLVINSFLKPIDYVLSQISACFQKKNACMQNWEYYIPTVNESSQKKPQVGVEAVPEYQIIFYGPVYIFFGPRQGVGGWEF